MNILDENILAGQAHLLRKSRIQTRQIGKDLGRKGLEDEDIITILHQLARPTFFTRDRDFFKTTLCHARYCLVWLGMGPTKVGRYIRQFLRHGSFDTKAKRMGAVVRVAHEEIQAWRVKAHSLEVVAWE